MAANVNITIVSGNLTRDPELRATSSGLQVAQISIAANHKYKDKSGQWVDEVSFIDVELFGKQAETAGQYLKKGRPVMIEGRLKQDRWEDRNTGQKRSKLKVIGSRMHFIGAPPDKQGQGRPAQQQQSQQQRQGQGQQGYVDPQYGGSSPRASRPSMSQPQQQQYRGDPNFDQMGG